MSISSMGGAGSAGASQYLAELLSRLQTSTTTSTAPPPDAASDTDASSDTDTSNAATGSASPALSDQVVSALVMMQLQGTSPSSSSGSAGDPFAQAFSGLDTDGDGTLSQSELETAIEKAGGTADQADTVFSALGGTSSSGISEDTFKQAAVAGGPPPGGHHHHHGAHHATSASTSDIFSTLDTNQDGSVSADELSAAFSSQPASNGASGASDIFNAMDGNGDGSVSQTELTSYLGNLQKQSQTDQTTLASFMQLATQSYNSALSLSASTYGAQGAIA